MDRSKQRGEPPRAAGGEHLGKAAARVPGTAAQRTAHQHRQIATRSTPHLRLGVKAVIVAVSAILVLAGLYSATSRSNTNLAGAYPYAVAAPGVGAIAPPIDLQATDGSTFDLASLRGQPVLLFFQEGIGCEPCWTQMKDIQANIGRFRALGISRIVMITTDDLGALQQKVADEGLTLPVLSDPRFTVSSEYHANQYGMMGTSADGHTFVLVGKNGRIQWRADYGGPPEYTMYVPVPNLLADLRAGLQAIGRVRT